MEISHSRLLKFILPGVKSYKNKMADENTDSNIEGDVPRCQAIRKSLNNENGECEHFPQAQLITSTQSTNNDDDVQNEKTEDKKKTKIPVSRFRQTVERVSADRRGNADNESIPIRRSSIPKPTRPAPAKPERKTIAKPKTSQPVIKTPLTNDVETRKEVVKTPEIVAPEDEFEKLYEEVVNEAVNIDVSVLNPKIEDPERIENTFEEIIHDYDENKVEPIDVEKIKRSKIPFLKRQSLQDDRNSKIIAARDKVRLRSSMNFDENGLNDKNVDDQNDGFDSTNQEKVTNDTNRENDSENNDDLKEKHNRTIITSSRVNEEDDATKILSTITVTENEQIESSDKLLSKKQHMIIENIEKNSIKVMSPVFESFVVETTKTIEGEKKTEVKHILTHVTNNNDLGINKTDNNVNTNVPVEIDSELMKPDGNTNNVQDMKEREDYIIDPMLRERDVTYKVHEPVNKDAHNIEIENKLPKKESVMSKIALFEQKEPVKSNLPKHSKLPKLKTTQTTEKVHIHTPLIVDEVYKSEKIDTVNDSKSENLINNEDVSEIVKAEMVIIESPEMVRYDKENIPNGRNIEKTVLEEVLKPVLRTLEPKHDHNIVNGNEAKKYESSKSTIVVPRFTPVREVLKRYESLSEQKQTKKPTHVPKRSISEFKITPNSKSNHRSLDSMFMDHEKPLPEILKDIHTPVVQKESKDENIFFSNSVYTKTTENNKDNQIDNNIAIIEESKVKLDTERNNINNKENIEVKNKIDRPKFKIYDFSEEFRKPELEYKTLDSGHDKFKSLEFIQDYVRSKDERRAKSLVELDIGDAVKGKVNKIISRINSFDLLEDKNTENVVKVNDREKPRKRSVSEKIALFEKKLTPVVATQHTPVKPETVDSMAMTDDIRLKIEELQSAKKYGSVEVPSIELSNGVMMPVLVVGTALLDPRLTYHIVSAAIDLGYRAFDTAHIYGNEHIVGEAIRDKMADGTVKREDLFIISKLWSTFHRTDLVQSAYEASLKATGLEYFDLYLIHNPMSFKEGGSLIPKIANVLQYSSHDYLDAWYGLELLPVVRALGVSNFNGQQLRRVLDRARVKPVVNQVECHPYLSQQKLDNFCSERNISLSCFGVLGSKGTPDELKSGSIPVIDDPLVQVMASGLNVTPAQLLIRYQIQCGHSAVVKASSAARLWENLQALNLRLTDGELDALHALNRNKRNITFKGMGDTHKNYPFNAPF